MGRQRIALSEDVCNLIGDLASKHPEIRQRITGVVEGRGLLAGAGVTIDIAIEKATLTVTTGTATPKVEPVADAPNGAPKRAPAARRRR
jgi:hypothetical protein